MRLCPLALLPAAAVALASLLAAPRADACWDGYAAFVGRVSLSVADDSAWSPPAVREIARWGTRIDALLPPGTGLSSEFGVTTLCQTLPDGQCGDTLAALPPGSDALPDLFARTARLTHASTKDISRARALTVAPLTVQVFASKSALRAGAVAASIDEADVGAYGFINVGGFPAMNPTAHVVLGKDAAGNPLHRVVVGAFLDRAAAVATEASVRKALGLKGFVRPL